MPTRSDRNVPRRRISDDRGVHINFIKAAEVLESGQICVSTRGQKTPTILGSLGGTSAAVQVTQALFYRLHINGGTWTSSATLVGVRGYAKIFINWLASAYGIEDLDAADLTPFIVWEGIQSSFSDGGRQRNLRTFLADALGELRIDGDVYRDFLYGRALNVDQSSLEGYAPEVASAIEIIARQHVGEWYVRHRDAVRNSVGSLPVNWLRIPAPRLVQREWAEECPREFLVEEQDLAAAMVLLALIDDKGPNLSTIQSYTSDSFERAGEEASFVTGVKARNREVLRTPAPAGGLFSYGGLLEFVTAATRVDRMFRNHDLDFDRLLFVPSGSETVVALPEVNKWWRRNSNLWDLPGVSFPGGLSFRRLRKAAVLRGKQNGTVVIGHKPAMARLYLADALPEVILVPGILGTQSDVTDYWRTKTREIGMKVSSEAETEVSVISGLDGLINATAVMDVGVAACATNGQEPGDDSRPCRLGPVACFVCPNGYRTPEIIPGLAAAVEFTEDIRKYEPEEWVLSDAPILNSLAKKALAQFPPALVAGVPAEAIANSKVLIACVYMEGRTNE